MTLRGVPWVLGLIARGQFKVLWVELHFRFYRNRWNRALEAELNAHPRPATPSTTQIKLETEHPVAYKSPDHLVPWGTKYDNSTHGKFILFMEDRIGRTGGGVQRRSLDLGCSGGGLVYDFLRLGWVAVGLEGSDFSLKHGRAHWPELANRHLFTCDIGKPFRVLDQGQIHQCDLITMWEVLEHIRTEELPTLFQNILNHLKPGGYFIASTTSEPDIHDGVDLHQTKLTNAEWRQWVAKNRPELEWVDLGLEYYQFVRYNQERSVLTYRRKA
jgi:SAM-dependent methyltransferase